MATPGAGSDPDSLFGVSSKFQRKLNSFREVIERKKLEVRRVSKEMRSLIEIKEEEIIIELNTIWEEVNARVEKEETEIAAKIQVFEAKVMEVEKLFKELNPGNDTLLDTEKINSVKRQMDIDIPNVKLTWRVDEMRNCINRMFNCEQKILIYNKDTRYQLEWSKSELGNGDNQLYRPWGIATNPMNENIYVVDQSNNRVQIFSREGEWIRSIEKDDDDMKNPEKILFHNQSIYVQCSTAILKFNESTETKEKSKSYDISLGGICTDNIHIYVGQWKGMNLIVLTLDLIEENRISLKTEFCNQETEINSISQSQELFYILLFEAEFPIQAFSREGILIRCVVKDSINCAYCFCLDQQHNILLADCGDSSVKIFSSEGKLLTQFGERGSEKGQFSALIGISLNELGDIVTVQQNNSHTLQAFSLL